MAAKRKPAKKAAPSVVGAKRAAPRKAKTKTTSAGAVRTAVKRRPLAGKAKTTTVASKLNRAKKSTPAPSLTPSKASEKVPVRGVSPAQKSRPGEGHPAPTETRAVAVALEANPSAGGAVLQPAASVGASTTAAGEDSGTPGLPVPIASFTI